jgi:DNA-binding NtrC family response regulator
VPATEERTEDSTRTRTLKVNGHQNAEQILHAGQTIEEAERELIRLTLNHARGNRTKAAKMLGISRKSLYNKIKVYDIDA